MLNNPTLEKLRSLKLTGMADAFCEQLQHPLSDLEFETRLGLLIEREWCQRENSRLKGRRTYSEKSLIAKNKFHVNQSVMENNGNFSISPGNLADE